MKKVLIIDDEIDLCTLIAHFLKKRNYEVFIAHTIKDGLILINSSNLDVLLLDNNLPDGLGWGIVDQVHITFPEMTIILITAYGGTRQLKSKNERVKYLEKPLSLTNIEQCL